MNLKEFFLGTPQERAAQQTVKRLKALETLRPKQQQEKIEAERITRRLLLRRALLGGAAVISGAAVPLLVDHLMTQESLRVRQPFTGGGFENWAAYFNSELPMPKVLSIAADLINAPEYDGFPQAGRLLQTAVKNYRDLDQFNPRLISPVRVVLKPTVRGVIASFSLKTVGIGIEAKVVNKISGQTFNVNLVEVQNIYSAQLELEQTMAFGSRAVKALMIAKEISHLAYMRILRQLIFDEFNSTFTLISRSSLPVADLLSQNARFYPAKLDIQPPLGINYYGASTLLDWAGYWHIIPALGRMLKQGILTGEDKGAVAGNVQALNLAIQRGILSEQKAGVYVWREGIGPFSKEWQDVMRSIPQVPQLPSFR